MDYRSKCEERKLLDGGTQVYLCKLNVGEFLKQTRLGEKGRLGYFETKTLCLSEVTFRSLQRQLAGGRYSQEMDSWPKYGKNSN